MARMAGVWLWIAAPREVGDDVNLLVGGTIILTQQEVNKIGNQALSLRILIMDDDTFNDNEVDAFSDTFAGPFNVGPNSFQTRNLIVPHDKVSNSEPWNESVAELYAKVRVAPATTVSIKTNWAESNNVYVHFE
jgi:hypothetical protein